MSRFTYLVSILLLAAPNLQAGKFNKVLNVGDAAPEWKDLEGTDGKKHSSADFAGKDVLVVVFTCNSCPVAVGYEDRILAFAKQHTGADTKVGLVAINVNTIKEDSMPEMTKRAEKRKFTFPYLHDPSQEIAKKFGAMYTPEFFVLNKERRIVYMGAMDDKSPPAEATVGHLEAAVKAALEGKAAADGETLARGCKIRFAR
jgi:peroxiredoxin